MSNIDITSRVFVDITAGARRQDDRNSVVKVKVLQPNMVNGVNMLTQQMIDAEGKNTVFVIKTNYNIDGTITMPANCAFEFLGGQLIGGTLIGNQTKMINLYDYQILNGTVRQGTFKNITAILEL
jgi:hypothetical protein